MRKNYAIILGILVLLLLIFIATEFEGILIDTERNTVFYDNSLVFSEQKVYEPNIRFNYPENFRPVSCYKFRNPIYDNPLDFDCAHFAYIETDEEGNEVVVIDDLDDPLFDVYWINDETINIDNFNKEFLDVLGKTLIDNEANILGDYYSENPFNSRVIQVEKMVQDSISIVISEDGSFGSLRPWIETFYFFDFEDGDILFRFDCAKREFKSYCEGLIELVINSIEIVE